jgi:Tfp pilus assembly protein PilZ
MPIKESRRVDVIASYGRLVHEIRVSMTDGRWEARIVTLPNQIWVEPGGRSALVFESDSAEKAEEMAVAFVQRDSVVRGHRLADSSYVDDGSGDHEPARRRAARCPVRYQPRGKTAGKETRRAGAAATANLSETGIFIATEDPLPAGSRLEIDLRLPGFAERLAGVVIWTCRQSASGRELGMGVKLLDPPFSYRARIQSL